MMLRNKNLIIFIYLSISCILQLYNYIYGAESYILYGVEPNKGNSTGSLAQEGSEYVYKSPADQIHDSIKEIDEKIKKLDPNSKNYLKEKETLESIRSEYENQMPLISQFRSSRAKYIPEISDNKRLPNDDITTNASKRTRS